MGREIRKVPPNWEHPRYTKDDCNSSRQIGSYRSCGDEDYETAAKEWIENFDLWRKGKHERQQGEFASSCKYYWEYAGIPDEETCRPAFTEEPTWFQVYETVSEGTPVTPPFATKEELVEYLVSRGDFWRQENGEGGFSRKAAESFVKDEWVPSMVVDNGQIYSGIEAASR